MNKSRIDCCTHATARRKIYSRHAYTNPLERRRNTQNDHPQASHQCPNFPKNPLTGFLLRRQTQFIHSLTAEQANTSHSTTEPCGTAMRLDAMKKLYEDNKPLLERITVHDY